MKPPPSTSSSTPSYAMPCWWRFCIRAPGIGKSKQKRNLLHHYRHTGLFNLLYNTNLKVFYGRDSEITTSLDSVEYSSLKKRRRILYISFDLTTSQKFLPLKKGKVDPQVQILINMELHCADTEGYISN